MTDDLIDRIYESSFVPELWPGILDALSDIAGARGGVLFAAHSKVLNWTATANLAETFRAYVEDGWLRRYTRRACLLTHTHPGFLVEHDLWKQDELDSNPIYRDFLLPRGLGWSAGTALPMPTGDNIVFSLTRLRQRTGRKGAHRRSGQAEAASCPQRAGRSTAAPGARAEPEIRWR
jgi:hypothetical protein